MKAMIVKEFRQLTRDRRTLIMMIALPVLLLIIFGYAANFEVSHIPTVVAGPQAERVAKELPSLFDVVEVDPGGDRATATSRLQDGDAVVGVVTGSGPVVVLMDGTQIFSVQSARTALLQSEQRAQAAGVKVPPISLQILYNPSLTTSWIMIPGLTGLILVFIGTTITSLGVVRERQSGTIEQLAVMPLRPSDVIVGKIVPYFLVASLDLVLIVALGNVFFGAPFVGSMAVFALGAALFLMVTLGLGVLISTVSQNQGQAIQLAMMITLPQVLLSGLIFPIASMSAGVRWLSYIFPLTYYIEIARGVMLKDTPITALWEPLLLLSVLGVVVLSLAIIRFRRDLAPGGRRHRIAESDAEPSAA